MSLEQPSQQQPSEQPYTALLEMDPAIEMQKTIRRGETFTAPTGYSIVATNQRSKSMEYLMLKEGSLTLLQLAEFIERWKNFYDDLHIEIDMWFPPRQRSLPADDALEWSPASAQPRAGSLAVYAVAPGLIIGRGGSHTKGLSRALVTSVSKKAGVYVEQAHFLGSGINESSELLPKGLITLIRNYGSKAEQTTLQTYLDLLEAETIQNRSLLTDVGRSNTVVGYRRYLKPENFKEISRLRSQLSQWQERLSFQGQDVEDYQQEQRALVMSLNQASTAAILWSPFFDQMKEELQQSQSFANDAVATLGENDDPVVRQTIQDNDTSIYVEVAVLDKEAESALGTRITCKYNEAFGPTMGDALEVLALENGYRCVREQGGVVAVVVPSEEEQATRKTLASELLAARDEASRAPHIRAGIAEYRVQYEPEKMSFELLDPDGNLKNQVEIVGPSMEDWILPEIVQDEDGWMVDYVNGQRDNPQRTAEVVQIEWGEPHDDSGYHFTTYKINPSQRGLQKLLRITRAKSYGSAHHKPQLVLDAEQGLVHVPKYPSSAKWLDSVGRLYETTQSGAKIYTTPYGPVIRHMSTSGLTPKLSAEFEPYISNTRSWGHEYKNAWWSNFKKAMCDPHYTWESLSSMKDCPALEKFRHEEPAPPEDIIPSPRRTADPQEEEKLIVRPPSDQDSDQDFKMRSEESLIAYQLRIARYVQDPATKERYEAWKNNRRK